MVSAAVVRRGVQSASARTLRRGRRDMAPGRRSGVARDVDRLRCPAVVGRGADRDMADNGDRAEAWTSTLREQQSALDLGAELGPADPAAYTIRKPIPEPMPPEKHGPARIIALANQKGG